MSKVDINPAMLQQLLTYSSEYYMFDVFYSSLDSLFILTGATKIITLPHPD